MWLLIVFILFIPVCSLPVQSTFFSVNLILNLDKNFLPIQQIYEHIAQCTYSYGPE